jgi:hypothetical protein
MSLIKEKPNQSITLSDQKVVNTPQETTIKSFTSDNTKITLDKWTNYNK